MFRPSKLSIAAASGLISVSLGAFGAHALRASFSPQQINLWETAVFYQFIHTAVLLWLSRQPDLSNSTFLIFTGGILLFSGSLYLLALTGLTWIGIITPIGGVLLLTGWGMLIYSGAVKTSTIPK